jgi:hypothetical protein
MSEEDKILTMLSILGHTLGENDNSILEITFVKNQVSHVVIIEATLEGSCGFK